MSESRVFVSRLAEEPFMEISSGGEFINPIMSAFSLRDTKSTKTKTDKFYVVVTNRILSYVKLSARGYIPGITLNVSWSPLEDQFASTIEQEMQVDANNTVYAIPFYVRVQVVDSLDTVTMDQYRNVISLRLVYV